jgi:hypothetical protein
MLDLAAYRLLAGSLCIDAGTDATVQFPIGRGTRDFFGAAIPAGSGYDIGAGEFTPDPTPIRESAGD